MQAPVANTAAYSVLLQSTALGKHVAFVPNNVQITALTQALGKRGAVAAA